MPLFLFILLFICFPEASARDAITPTQPLGDNETLISADGTFALGFFRPGNSTNRYIGLWYNKITDKTAVWVTNRKEPVINSTGLLSISRNGTLLITDQNSNVVWSSHTTANVANPVAQLLNTGNLVITEADGPDESYAWQGFDYPTDTLIAGMKMGVDLKSKLNRTLTAWTSDSDPSPSQHYLMIDIRGDPELVLCTGSTQVWRSGPWNGVRYSGIPSMITYSGINFSFINDKQEITYSYITSPSALYKLTVNQSGVVQSSLWEEDDGIWNCWRKCQNNE